MNRSRATALITAGSALLLMVPMFAGSPAQASAAPRITHAARIALATPRAGGRAVRNTWSASNWSGYAETGTFTGVSGTWTVPAVSATSNSTYSSAWIGVDGFNDSSLIQTGTEEDYYGGSAHYDAWWEILPAAETEISPTAYPVSPGDQITASIYETSATTTSSGFGFGRGRKSSTEHVWDISIADTTQKWSFTTSQGYNGAGSSAEWILEAPEVNGRIASLAHYTISPLAPTAADFDSAGVLTAIPTGTPTYTSAGLNYASDSGVMVQNGVQVSTPGDPDAALTGFDIAYGSTLPPTPSS